MSELFTLYSPAGEMFENISKANRDDLVRHAGWTASPPASIAASTVPPVTSEEEDVDDSAEEQVSEDEIEDQASDETTEEKVIRKTVEDFADLTEKTEVAAYIATTFPEARIDGRANRDKLVAQAIELATAE